MRWETSFLRLVTAHCDRSCRHMKLNTMFCRRSWLSHLRIILISRN
uniref:TBC1 domain family protein n=1 Tax=Cherax quadricarinatus TaxID=27406 RepID=G0ZJ59_CHEQU|nr:TBC1 domain family protein [Cherax quadricarinatus]